jgi:hypothetical protein
MIHSLCNCSNFQSLTKTTWFVKAVRKFYLWTPPLHTHTPAARVILWQSRNFERGLLNKRGYNQTFYDIEKEYNMPLLIDYLRCYVPIKNISLIWRHHHCRWKPPKFRPMLGAQGLWVGMDLYRATPAVTRDLGFSISSKGPPHSVASFDTREDVEGLF